MQIAIETPPDFDFLKCINSHGWRQLPPFYWTPESEVLRRVEDFDPGHPVVIDIQRRGNLIVVDAPKRTDEEMLRFRVKRVLQLDKDLSEFHAFCRTAPHLADIPVMKQGRLLRSPTLFEDLLKVICTTNTTWTQTKGMVSRLVSAYGAPAADGLGSAFPTAERIASVSTTELNTVSRLGYRAASIHKICADVASGALDLESFENPEVSSADLYKRLLALPGVGPYAASCLLIYLGRYDRVNVDSWARTMVARELGHAVSDKDVHAFFEPYGEWKALVYHFYPWEQAPPEY